ncbi:MAG TPA: hypothetical protein EYP04_11135 [Anaerolineae bacterium]|nr:hypothetical protein [Anaerolineae bacterium]
MSVTAQAPATAGAARVRLYVNKSGNATGTAYFDDVSFFPSTANAVTLNSLTAASKSPRLGSTLARLAAPLAATATLALGCLLWARRRRGTKA